MDQTSKHPLSGLIGHTISQFILYSYSKLEDSKYADIGKSSSNDNDRSLTGNTPEDDDSDYSTDSDDKNYVGDDDKIQSDDSELLLQDDKPPAPPPEQKPSDAFCSFDTSYYKQEARLQNMNLKNDVGYTRFISNVHMDEARSILYGSWDPEQSENMWREINGADTDVDIVFSDVQIVAEEDLIRTKRKLPVSLATSHINDFVKYGIIQTMENTNTKFTPNVKYVLLFGGANLTESYISESNQNMYSLLNRRSTPQLSNALYFSEAQSFKSSWEHLETQNPPEPRAFHASCVVYASLENPVLLVCGGFTRNRELLPCDLHILNLAVQPLAWDVFKTSGPLPPSRYGHSLSYVGSYLVVFGGTDGQTLFDDVWVLNINDGNYSVPGKLSGNSWSKVDFIGLTPSPRAFHSCCKVGISSNSPMVVYGGLTYYESMRNRLYALHFINDKLIWNILPVYVKCPSESRAFHSMIYVDHKLLVTGGDDYNNANIANLRTLAYSLENKSFQYIDDSINLSGHCSWTAFGMTYHWGGVRLHGPKLYFDDSISISNPLAYSDDRNIEEIYFKYIRYASLNNIYSETGRDEPDFKDEDIKIDIDIDLDENEVKLFEDLSNEDNRSDLPPDISDSDYKASQTELPEFNEENVVDSYRGSDSVVKLHHLTKPEQPQPPVVQPPPTQTHSSRPRRSAAIKCLTAIELDNMKHKEQEMREANSQS